MKTTVSVRLHNAGSHWQSLCHVCLQCIEGKHWAKMQYYRNCVLKKDMRNKPSKAPISNHIYCTLICDLQLLSTKLHFFFVFMGGAFEHDVCSTVQFLQCCEENVRNAQEMAMGRGNGHA